MATSYLPEPQYPAGATQPVFGPAPAPAPAPAQTSTAPTTSLFAGVQGAGTSAPLPTNYTWGGDPAARRIYDPRAATDQYANNPDYFKARDAATGDWLYVKAGEMKPYDTTGMEMIDASGYGQFIPKASANVGGYVATSQLDQSQHPSSPNYQAPSPPFVIGPSPNPPTGGSTGGGTGTTTGGTTGGTGGTTAPGTGGASGGQSSGSIYQNLANSAQYNATTQAYNEDRGVAGRVDEITSKNSPLMQRAQTRALQSMNARGLTNSSIAVGAGQAAVIDAATPIANADAGLYNQQQLANQNAINTAARDNAAMRGNIGMEGMRLDESGRQFDVGQAGLNDRFGRELGENARQFDVNQAGTNARFMQELAQRGDLFNRELDNKLQLAGMDRDTRLAVVKAQTDAQTLIAGNENIANAWGTTMSAIDKIQNNPDLDPATKVTLINNALGGFHAFTNFWKKANGGAIDVSDLLDFGISGAGGGAGSPTGDSGAGGGGAGSGSGTGGVGWDPNASSGAGSGGEGSNASVGIGSDGVGPGMSVGPGSGNGSNSDGSGVGDGSDGGW